MKKIFLLIVVGISLCSCGISRTMAKMNLSIESVDVTKDNQSFIDNSVDNISVDDVKYMTYKDDVVDIKWSVGKNRFVIVLENLTNQTIKVLWDDAAYIGPSGIATRVMHTGTKYSERNDFQPPSIVPKKAAIEEVVIPTGNVYYADGWNESYLLIYNVQNNKDFDVIKRNYIGKSVKVLLPILIREEKIEYLFNFTIQSVTKFTVTPNYSY